MTGVGVNRGQRLNSLLLKLTGGFFVAFIFIFAGAPVMAARWDEVVHIHARVDQVISVYIEQDTLGLKAFPTADGTFVYDTSEVSVSTNSKYGYTLYMSTLNDGTSLTRDDDLDDEISSISKESIVLPNNYDDFEINSWGYSLKNNLLDDINTGTTFSPVPNTDQEISSSDVPVENEQIPITVGVKVDTDVHAGIYQNTLVFTAISEIIWDDYVVPDFYNIATMQDMTSAICSSAITPQPGVTRVDHLGVYFHDDTWVPEITLTDERDGRRYKIRKLADGNCWMVEDLRFGLRRDMELTSANTNLVSMNKWIVDTNALVNYREAAGNNIGYYYTWYAATANNASGTLGQNNSICPKGWTLPTPDGDRSYQELFDQYPTDGSSTMVTPWDEPVLLNRAGSYDDEESVDAYAGYIGSYWVSGESGYAGSGNSIFFGWLDPMILPTAKGASMPIRCLSGN